MNKKKIAVIGSGVSGLSIAQLLKNDFSVKVFEKQSRPGGLIKCDRVDGNLYHMVGGHVFNSKRQDVLDWFWSQFDQDKEFIKAIRNATVFMDKPIGYPIENHLYQMDPEVAKAVVSDLLEIEKGEQSEPSNFGDFLKQRFGKTLYSIYFKPYNEKIWKRDLSGVPLSWLAGKLPMPTVEEILCNNISQEKEMNMVHSSFYYPKVNGSQFLVERLAEGLDIECGVEINTITRSADERKWHINGGEGFDSVIFTGNIKSLIGVVDPALGLGRFDSAVQALEYHGTTTVLCEIEQNPYSWVYMPDPDIAAHRIINTGNFSDTNNHPGIKTATVEFTDYIEKEEILSNLERMPFNLRYLAHEFTEYTYPIQDGETRPLIDRIKQEVEPHGMYITGRFAEWEYYNMDAAMGAAIDLLSRIYV
ncbi:NAD(P)-binding protein [Pontiellaceae bacterium B12227]|nr:NAD(P)-binding protein [Pontiellaceae bacterium B12227]